jgi:hypothetical protein
MRPGVLFLRVACPVFERGKADPLQLLVLEKVMGLAVKSKESAVISVWIEDAEN